MQLSDVFEQLTFGELSQNSLGSSEGEQISPSNYRKVLSHVNLGLQELHKRFWLRSDSVIVEMYDHIQIYHLKYKYAQSNILGSETYKYIMDTPENPFLDNVLKIEGIYDEHGNQFVLNDLTDCCSLFTVGYKSIQIPLPVYGQAFSVQYRGNHPVIPYTLDFDPEEVEVDLPDGLVEALLLYVGGRVSASLNADQGVEASQYWQRFELSCKRAQDLGLEVTPDLSNLKLDCNGWV